MANLNWVLLHFPFMLNNQDIITIHKNTLIGFDSKNIKYVLESFTTTQLNMITGDNHWSSLSPNYFRKDNLNDLMMRIFGIYYTIDDDEMDPIIVFESYLPKSYDMKIIYQKDISPDIREKIYKTPLDPIICQVLINYFLSRAPL